MAGVTSELPPPEALSWQCWQCASVSQLAGRLGPRARKVWQGGGSISVPESWRGRSCHEVKEPLVLSNTEAKMDGKEKKKKKRRKGGWEEVNEIRLTCLGISCSKLGSCFWPVSKSWFHLPVSCLPCPTQQSYPLYLCGQFRAGPLTKLVCVIQCLMCGSLSISECKFKII